MRLVRSLAAAAAFSAPLAFAQAPEAPCGALKTTSLPPCDAPAKPKADAPALAAVDGKALDASVLDPELRKRIEGVDATVAAARKAALEDEIADVRLHLESERLGVPFRDYWEAEVFRKTAPASEADVKAEFDRATKWFPGKTLKDLKPRLESVVVFRNRDKREAELAASLKERYPATMGADPSAPNLAPDAVLSTVGGRPITAASAATRLDAASYGVRANLYYEEAEAVYEAVTAQLLAGEAERRGVTREALLKAEVEDKVVPPTAEEIAQQWEKVKGGAKGSLEENRATLTARMTEARRDAVTAAFQKSLLAGKPWNVKVAAPPAPVLAVDAAGAPWKGRADAKVVLVEYADFECPHCAHGFDQAEELLATHGDRIKYVVHTYPLPFHEHALKAAEAGAAAQAQGKFFEMAALMFKNQDALDVPALKKYAVSAGCDPARFGTDLDSGRHTVAVLLERRGGERVGVAGTPAFFVNGVPVLWDGTTASLKTAVDAALEKPAVPPAPSKPGAP